MVKLSDGGDEGELEDGVNGGDFVGKEVEFVGGEFLGLLVAMTIVTGKQIGRAHV